MDRVIRTPYAIETFECKKSKDYLEYFRSTAQHLNINETIHRSKRYSGSSVHKFDMGGGYRIGNVLYRVGTNVVDMWRADEASSRDMFKNPRDMYSTRCFDNRHQTSPATIPESLKTVLVECWRILPARHKPKAHAGFAKGEKEALDILVRSLQHNGEEQYGSVARAVLDGIGASDVQLIPQDPLTALYIHEVVHRWGIIERAPSVDTCTFTRAGVSKAEAPGSEGADSDDKYEVVDPPGKRGPYRSDRGRTRKSQRAA
jgi:hypothetical protein